MKGPYGGLWRFDMVGHGQTWANCHRYSLMQADRIAFVLDDDAQSPPMQVEVTLTHQAGGTRVTQTLTLPDAAARAAVMGYQADEKGLETLGKLVSLAQSL